LFLEFFGVLGALWSAFGLQFLVHISAFYKIQVHIRRTLERKKHKQNIATVYKEKGVEMQKIDLPGRARGLGS
jgi:hypothetical protein